MDLRAGMTVGEGQDIFHVRAAPGVDALGVVADRHYPVMRADQVDYLGLQDIRVLVLVNEDVPEAMGEICSGIR
jgi:hypothetical protein